MKDRITFKEMKAELDELSKEKGKHIQCWLLNKAEVQGQVVSTTRIMHIKIGENQKWSRELDGNLSIPSKNFKALKAIIQDI